MSDRANRLFAQQQPSEPMREASPGVNNFLGDVKAELSRLGTQGAMELASALFNGHGFVPYGPGQYTPSPELGPQHGPELGQELGQERGQELEISRER